ncbi:ABC transporter permease subunit [Nonomuraea sp. CA-218870]|uniref:ABC transporter permease subunit n=1 Tax=Nonomuraea sp. CA-218870 TaxID=3239998 RepID=UPI003D936C04
MTVPATDDKVRRDVTTPLRLSGVVRAEWVKIRSVRSTYALLIAAVVVSVALSGLIAWATMSTWEDRAEGFEPVSGSLIGLFFGQIAIMVFSILVISAEYTTGSIRGTLIAVPDRTRLLLAKVIITAALALAAGLVMSFGSFFVGQAVYATRGVETTIGADGVLVALLRGGLLICMTGVIALGVGFLARQSSAAIGVTFGIYFLPILFSGFLPEWFQKNVIKYMPNTSSAVMLYPDPAVPDVGVTPMSGFLTLSAWALAMLIPAALLFNRRDS